MTGPLIVGLLVTGGLWLVLQPGRVRTVLGFVLISHAANATLVLASTGGGSAVPIAGLGGDQADPLPQAFALTAVVISFGTTAFLLALAAGRDDAPPEAGRVEADADPATDDGGPPSGGDDRDERVLGAPADGRSDHGPGAGP